MVLCIDVTEHVRDRQQGRVALSSGVLTMAFPSADALPGAGALSSLVAQLLALPRRHLRGSLEVAAVTGRTGKRLSLVFAEFSTTDGAPGLGIITGWEAALMGDRLELDVRERPKEWRQ